MLAPLIWPKSAMKRLLTCLYLLAPLLAPLAHGAPTQIVYPTTEISFDDLQEILRGALERTVDLHGPYTLKPSQGGIMTEARYLNALQRGKTINVAWSSTSVQKERELLPIRFPLRKGLLGYRILLIDGRRQAEFDRIATLADLRPLTVGQGFGWGDVALYEAAGIRVTTAPYENLFRMVVAGRFDLFPRGIGEAFREYAAHHVREPHLAIERNLMLYYPWPYYFFVNRSDRALAERIEIGLRLMQADGSFDALFWRYNRDAIEQARTYERRLIRIPNPLLPAATPLDDPTLWFDPVRDRVPASATQR